MARFIAGCSLAVAVASNAASATPDVDIISRMDSRMETLDDLIFNASHEAHAPQFLDWKAQAPDDSLYSAYRGALASAQIDVLKAATGVQVTGQTYYRPDAALGIDEDDDEVSRYVGKIQIEARWYFLQSGLLKRQGRIDEINLKADIDRLEHEKTLTLPDLYVNRERLREVSDSLLASVMLHRVDNLQLLEDAYMYLLDSESISSDNLLRILDDRAEAERRMSTMTTTPVHAVCLESVTAGTVAIDTTAVLSSLADTDLDLKLLDLKSKLITRQADNITWWSDVRLAPFVRYSHYFRHAMKSSANVDIGMSFTIPVNTEASRQRKAKLAEKQLLETERDIITSKAADRVRYLASETERLNRAIAGEWQRASTLRKYLRMRRDAYTNREGEYNRLSALMEYNSYLRCLENIIDLQYRRDTLLADLQALVPTMPLTTWCTFTPLTP